MDGPINIAGLQQFACEYGCTNKLESFEKVESHGKKVAVIGSGPAGLACATELAKKGFSVTVFEKENSAGGVPVQTIPSYRLPNAAISDAVNTAKQLGVNFVFGKTISGKDAVKNLLNDGYKACFVSTGLVTSTELPLFNGFQNVANAKSFLNTVKFGSKPNFNGKNVAVIGGGSVAMDAAITAKALGASNVYAVSLEALNELPADPEEIELARGAHVTFIPASQITEVVSEGKNISALKGVNITWAEAGNFSPANARPVAGTSFTIKADYVIQAIGSSAGAEIKELATGLKHKGRGTIAVSDAFATDVKGVFAGGDIVNGGASIAQAVGEGKKAAESIHRYLLGTEK
ncbi:MAG: Sulfide dehydrogenase (Flavoprotein) subunit SudA [uncultured bacterium]|nr:MAG: Sulfide dehydrogenase (Flavoprotein) subunit SudA [uncultured bacterium]